MRTIASLILLAAAGCSRSAERATPASSAAPASATAKLSQPVRNELAVTTAGEPFGLRAGGGALSFCDERGGRKLDGATSEDVAFERTCAKDDEPNTACRGLPLDVGVSTPGLGPNDVVDVSGKSFALDGRVHDCAADGKVLAIVTGSAVLLVDTESGKTEAIAREGGDRVSVAPEWVLWSHGASVHAKRRHP